MTETLRETVRSFITDSFLFGDATALPADGGSLIAGDIIDSTGVLELVAFIEDTFKVTMSDADIVPDNLDSIDNIVAFVERAPHRLAAA